MGLKLRPQENPCSGVTFVLRDAPQAEASLETKGCTGVTFMLRDASQGEASLETKGCTGVTFVLRDASQGETSLWTKGCYKKIPWSKGNFPLEMHPLARRLHLCIPWLQGIFFYFFLQCTKTHEWCYMLKRFQSSLLISKPFTSKNIRKLKFESHLHFKWGVYRLNNSTTESVSFVKLTSNNIWISTSITFLNKDKTY